MSTTLALALPDDLIALQREVLSADRALGDYALAVRDQQRTAFPGREQAVQRCSWEAAEQSEFDRLWAAYLRAGEAVRGHPVLVRARILRIDASMLQALREAAAGPER